MIHVFPIDAEGGHLVGAVFGQNRQRPMLNAGGNDALIAENLQHFVRLCRGADVPVAGPLAHQRVAHTAADNVGFVAVRFQAFDQLFGALWNVNVHGITPFLNNFFETLLY